MDDRYVWPKIHIKGLIQNYQISIGKTVDLW